MRVMMHYLHFYSTVETELGVLRVVAASLKLLLLFPLSESAQSSPGRGLRFFVLFETMAMKE